MNSFSHQNYVLVCRGAYYVLEKYIIGNSRKNELYVAKHIPFFQGQVRFPRLLPPIFWHVWPCFRSGRD